MNAGFSFRERALALGGLGVDPSNRKGFGVYMTVISEKTRAILGKFTGIRVCSESVKVLKREPCAPFPGSGGFARVLL